MSNQLTLKEMRAELENYAGKITGNYKEVMERLKRFRKGKQKKKDYRIKYITIEQMRAELKLYGGKMMGDYKRVMERLKRFRKGKQKDSDYPYGKRLELDIERLNGEEVFNESCGICLESNNVNESIKTKCNHAFHKKCIGQWMLYDHTCPLCRKYIERK